MQTKPPFDPTSKNLPVASAGMLVQARGLSVSDKRSGASLSKLSLHANPGELIVVMGVEPAGKEILLETLAGMLPPDSGKALANEVEIFPHRNVFQAYIGYVPRRIAFNEALTVRETLDDEAQIRLPRGASREEREQQVQSTLSTLGLQDYASDRVSRLENYEKRLLSIAIEWINRPALLLVNEPRIALDPMEEARITGCLKGVASQGCTVFQSSNSAGSALAADKILLLAPAGTLAWYGPAAEALVYFRQFQAEGHNGDSGAAALVDIYSLLKTPGSAGPQNWAEKFAAHPAYEMYVDDPLDDKHPDLLLQDHPMKRFRGASQEPVPPPKVRRSSFLRRFGAITSQTFRVLFRQKTGLLMLLVPLLVALMDFLLSSPDMSDPMLGDSSQVPVVLGLLVFLTMLVSAMLFQNVMLKDREIYRWDHRSVSLAFPYVMAKILLVGLFALYQGVIWTAIHYLATGMNESLYALPAYWATFTLVAFTGGIIGLIASAATRSNLPASVLVLVVLIAQLLLSGSLIPLPHLHPLLQPVTYLDPSRYAFESLLTIDGYGKDIVTDACWQLPEDQRAALTDYQKQGCACMGDNIYSRCNFPGIHKFFTYVIEQPMPSIPTPPSNLENLPPQPILSPGETQDQFASAVSQYTAQISQLQDVTKNYVASLQTFLQNLSDWQRGRSLVIGNAEGVIAQAYDHYGNGFQVDLTGHWLILAAMNLILILLLALIQWRKGFAG